MNFNDYLIPDYVYYLQRTYDGHLEARKVDLSDLPLARFVCLQVASLM
jgi:hypothetical protein